MSQGFQVVSQPPYLAVAYAQRETLLRLASLYQKSDVKRATSHNYLHPRDFFSLWIEEIWGETPDKKIRWRKACLAELARHLGNVASYETMRKWQWDAGEEDFFPNYLPALLCQLDERYQERKVLGILPRRSLD